MARNRIQEQLTEGAQQIATDAGNGLFSHLKAMVKGTFGGLLWGGIKWGVPIFLMQITGAARPIATALGGEQLANTVAGFGLTDDGVDNIGRRALVSAGLGALMGAAGGGAKGLVVGDPGENNGGVVGMVVGAGAALVAAAVVIGSAKNGNLSLADNRTPPNARTPRPAAEPAQS